MQVYYKGKNYDMNNPEEKGEFNRLTEEEKTMQSAKELISGMVDFARKGQHKKFEFIRSFEEADVVLVLLKSLRKTNLAFKKGYKSSFKIYKKTGDVSPLLSYTNLKQAYEFYEIEIATVKDMLKEWISYAIRHLNFFAEGGYRPEEDLKDWRYPNNRN